MELELFREPNGFPTGAPEFENSISGAEKDDRGRASKGQAQNVAKKSYKLSYNSGTFEYSIEDDSSPTHDVALLQKILNQGPTYVDATTLGFVDVLLCVRAAYEIGSDNLWLGYVEPGSYSSHRSGGVLHKRDFKLTDEASLFSAVPGAALLLTRPGRKRVVFLAGYEGDRIHKALEQNPISGKDCNILFGVPAFRSGWEMDAFANNIGIIEEEDIRSVLFAGATNPLSTYQALEKVYASCSDEERLVIVPVGTKPQGIGAALFSVAHPKVGLIYDHPRRRKNRSSDVGMWHLYHPMF